MVYPKGDVKGEGVLKKEKVPFFVSCFPISRLHLFCEAKVRRGEERVEGKENVGMIRRDYRVVRICVSLLSERDIKGEGEHSFVPYIVHPMV
jgi:hypothetical protein